MLETITLDLVLVAAVPVLLVAGVLVRRRALVRHGFDMGVRLRARRGGGGWSLGVARYEAERLEWFRTFSLWPRPRRVFQRQSLQVLSTRPATRAESLLVPPGHIVAACRHHDRDVDLSLSDGALTGLLAWIEAAPPGRGLIA